MNQILPFYGFSVQHMCQPDYAAPAKTPSPMLETDTCSKTPPNTASLPRSPIATTHGSAASRCLELARPRTGVVAGSVRYCRRRCNQHVNWVNQYQDIRKQRGGKTPTNQHFTQSGCLEIVTAILHKFLLVNGLSSTHLHINQRTHHLCLLVLALQQHPVAPRAAVSSSPGRERAL